MVSMVSMRVSWFMFFVKNNPSPTVVVAEIITRNTDAAKPMVALLNKLAPRECGEYLVIKKRPLVSLHRYGERRRMEIMVTMALVAITIKTTSRKMENMRT